MPAHYPSLKWNRCAPKEIEINMDHGMVSLHLFRTLPQALTTSTFLVVYSLTRPMTMWRFFASNLFFNGIGVGLFSNKFQISSFCTIMFHFVQCSLWQSTHLYNSQLVLVGRYNVSDYVWVLRADLVMCVGKWGLLYETTWPLNDHLSWRDYPSPLAWTLLVIVNRCSISSATSESPALMYLIKVVGRLHLKLK